MQALSKTFESTFNGSPITTHRRCQSVPLRERKQKIHTINQKPVPMHYQYYQSNEGRGTKGKEKYDFLEFWGCIVPKQNNIIIKKKLEKACSAQLGQKKQMMEMTHSKLSSQIILQKYLKRKKTKQNKQVFMRSLRKIQEGQETEIMAPNGFTNARLQSPQTSTWKHTCLTTDMTEGESKWNEISRNKNDDQFYLTNAIDSLQKGIVNKFSGLDIARSRLKSMRDRKIWAQN